MKKLYLLLFACIFIIGCATNMPIENYLSVKNIKKFLEEDIKINESTDEDVRKLFGDPQIISRYEASSVESELSKLPLLDQLTKTLKTNVAPATTWTYIEPLHEKSVQAKRTIQVLGIDVYYKDVRITNIFFNKKREVLGYSVSSHSIQ
ncbi:MAG: hypothetical protein PHY73_01335 [Candidatus Omnitrophica bacterium]|nr:hypothetical protein [Candidatus Omnitrophota bacterium]